MRAIAGAKCALGHASAPPLSSLPGHAHRMHPLLGHVGHVHQQDPLARAQHGPVSCQFQDSQLPDPIIVQGRRLTRSTAWQQKTSAVAEGRGSNAAKNTGYVSAPRQPIVDQDINQEQAKTRQTLRLCQNRLMPEAIQTVQMLLDSKPSTWWQTWTGTDPAGVGGVQCVPRWSGGGGSTCMNLSGHHHPEQNQAIVLCPSTD